MSNVEVRENFDVKNLTSLKIGGKIKKVYFPKSITEFEEVFTLEPESKVFGNLSNTLVSSDGYDGTIIITTNINEIKIDGCIVHAGCGVKGPKLAQKAAGEGLSGFEFMVGFPGSLGGNIFMNASANGQCISDKLIKVICFSAKNGIYELKKDEMEFSYRTSICQKVPIIILGAEFKLEKGTIEGIERKMNENLSFRKTHQPALSLPNCGSIFKNPDKNSAGRLLEDAGAKAFSIGGVHVWENHANFIINTRAGKSDDVLEIMYKMFSAVKEKFGIELEPEIKFLGGKNLREVELCKILNIK